MLLEGEPGRPTAMDHLGVELGSPEEVHAATARPAAEGLWTRSEDDVVCCYARRDKVWVTGPGAKPWKVHAVIGDSAVYGTDSATGACCVT